MKHLFLLLLTTSCVTSQDSQDKKDYKANLIDIQMPYTLGYYELKGDVIGLEKSFLGNSMDSTQLYKFDTENYTFQDGFLKEYHKENVEGNTYKVKKIISNFEEGKPTFYENRLNGQSDFKESISYDKEGRIAEVKNSYSTNKHTYDEKSRLLNTIGYKNTDESILFKWSYEYDENDHLSKRTVVAKDYKTGEFKKRSYALFENDRIVKDYRYKDDVAHLSSEYFIENNGKKITFKNNKGKTVTHEYIYDDMGNWILYTEIYKEELFTIHRVISYANGVVTGKELSDPKAIAKLKNLTYNIEYTQKKQQELERLRSN